VAAVKGGKRRWAAKGGRQRWWSRGSSGGGQGGQAQVGGQASGYIKAQLAVKLWPGMATSTRCILKKII
jgi:hypothetical protein